MGAGLTGAAVRRRLRVGGSCCLLSASASALHAPTLRVQPEQRCLPARERCEVMPGTRGMAHALHAGLCCSK